MITHVVCMQAVLGFVNFRDGVRQSGLFIAACYLLDKLKVDREVDVCFVVKQIRQSRPQFILSVVGTYIIYYPPPPPP